MNSAVRSRRSTASRVWMAVAGVLLFCVFVGLGTWQVQRRAWKLDLIARVDARVHAPPVAPPLPGEWARVTAANSEYRHVRVSGTFLNDSETPVQALTELGAGFWVVTPLRVGDGTVVLVNRGFVGTERRDRGAHGAGDSTTGATVTGLLRISEPKGWFLRRNDPARGLWYSRDVEAIAAARGLGRVAPYFIDQEAGGGVNLGGATGGGAAGGGEASEGGTGRGEARGGVTGGAATGRAEAGEGGIGGDGTGGVTGAQGGTSGGSLGETNTAPIGGLTVIAFRNAHLTYAITWYGLALMVLVGAWIVIREERRRA